MVMERGEVILTDAQEVDAYTQADVVARGECKCTATAYDVVGHGSSKRGVCLCGSR